MVAAWGAWWAGKVEKVSSRPAETSKGTEQGLGVDGCVTGDKKGALSEPLRLHRMHPNSMAKIPARSHPDR